MDDNLARYNDQACALMRIVTVFMFSFYGTPKIFGIQDP